MVSRAQAKRDHLRVDFGFLMFTQRDVAFCNFFGEFIRLSGIGAAQCSLVLHLLINIESFLIRVLGGVPLGFVSLCAKRGVRVAQLSIQQRQRIARAGVCG